MNFFPPLDPLVVSLFLDVLLLECLIHVAKYLDIGLFPTDLLLEFLPLPHEAIELLSDGGGEEVDFDLGEVLALDRIEVEVVQVRGDFIELGFT